VPKPLKFLHPHYEKIKELQGKVSDAKTKAMASDVVSLLAMTQEGRDCLTYRLTGTDEPIEKWGHECVAPSRHSSNS
jgi:26S proteasome regulatory subunit N1